MERDLSPLCSARAYPSRQPGGGLIVRVTLRIPAEGTRVGLLARFPADGGLWRSPVRDDPEHVLAFWGEPIPFWRAVLRAMRAVGRRGAPGFPAFCAMAALPGVEDMLEVMS